MAVQDCKENYHAEQIAREPKRYDCLEGSRNFTGFERNGTRWRCRRPNAVASLIREHYMQMGKLGKQGKPQ